jgi:O-6-methylguanine DNA methyltransferase
VWSALQDVGYGELRTYAQVASGIGASQAVRAVGAANGANPVPIIVPCHRIIGSNGRLVGYGGGLNLKRRLLELEGVMSAFEPSLPLAAAALPA